MTLPLAILAGLPRPDHLRNKKYSPTFTGWEYVRIPSSCDRPDLRKSWPAVLELADLAPKGAHIFAFHAFVDGRGAFERDVYARHRLVWLPTELHFRYGSAGFTAEAQRRLDFEVAWRGLVRPNQTNQALILPETSFRPATAYEASWRRAQRVDLERDSLDSVAANLKSFKQAHHRPSGFWLDTNRLVFAGRHDHAPADRKWQWKYTYLLPATFHFDVRHERDHTSFTVADRDGNRLRFSSYTNIDSHGCVRGGR